MRKIIHLDLDAFFCAVEEKNTPSLHGTCFAVGGDPNKRGVVSSCSYAARRHGVRSAMPMKKALAICPELKIVYGHYDQYRRNSRHVMTILRQFTNVIEQISIDEAFLDISESDLPVRVLGKQIQQRINEEVKLPCSLGIAENKLVAKIANDVGKSRYQGLAYPNTLTVVPPGTERAFLAPLPVQRMWGVGPKTAERLERIGVKTIGQLSEMNEAALFELFGQHGMGMVRHAQGIDHRPVANDGEVKSISQERTFAEDKSDGDYLRERIGRIALDVADTLRKRKLRATTVRLKIRWSDFSTHTRQKTMAASDDQQIIRQIALELFNANWTTGKPVRLIGVGVSGLVPREQQLGLWDEEVEKNQKIFDAIHELEERFGKTIITHGSDLSEGNDDHLE